MPLRFPFTNSVLLVNKWEGVRKPALKPRRLALFVRPSMKSRSRKRLRHGGTTGIAIQSNEAGGGRQLFVGGVGLLSAPAPVDST